MVHKIMAVAKHCLSPHRNSDRYLLDEYFMTLIIIVMRTLAPRLNAWLAPNEYSLEGLICMLYVICVYM